MNADDNPPPSPTQRRKRCGVEVGEVGWVCGNFVGCGCSIGGMDLVNAVLCPPFLGFGLGNGGVPYHPTW